MSDMGDKKNCHVLKEKHKLFNLCSMVVHLSVQSVNFNNYPDKSNLKISDLIE